MCFYDQNRMACGDYKWGHFRQHCSKEYRTGETCGMRLVMQVIEIGDKCRICQKIDTKKRSIRKEEEKIKRWNRESCRRASIEKAEEDIYHLQQEIYNLECEKLSGEHTSGGWAFPPITSTPKGNAAPLGPAFTETSQKIDTKKRSIQKEEEKIKRRNRESGWRADTKRKRGESTSPKPTMTPKRRIDDQTIVIPRSASHKRGISYTISEDLTRGYGEEILCRIIERRCDSGEVRLRIGSSYVNHRNSRHQ